MKKYHLYFIILCLLSSCLKNDNLKTSFISYKPSNIGDDWTISNPENEKINPELLNYAYELFYSEERYPMAISLIVVRNGKIVSEGYCKNPDDINRLNNLQSCTKSFTSILTGIALKQNILTTFDAPLYSYYPEYFDDNIAKRKITIKNCLLMQAGLDFNNNYHTEQLFNTEQNSLQYILNLDMKTDTGVVFHYNDGLPHLVGGVIQKASGMSVDEFANHYLFNPLGINEFLWEKSKDGLNFGAFSLYLKPRDFAKIGQLCLQKGNWNGVQIFDTTWLQTATQIQSGQTMAYGYYFWIFPALNGYAMEGHGGQFLFICPEKNLVIAYTAFPYTSDEWWDNSDLIEIIYNACE